MQIDLPRLVNEALLNLGCDLALISELDGHTAITLDFDERPSLFILQQDGNVWLWSQVAEYSEPVVAQRSAGILAELMRSDDSILGGHPSLTVNEGFLELRVILSPSCLDSGESLGDALSLFFERVSAMLQLIR